MQRDVLPFAQDLIWDASRAVVGYEIPFKKLFYKPEPARTLEDIDDDVAAVMERLMEKFEQVKK